MTGSTAMGTTPTCIDRSLVAAARHLVPDNDPVAGPGA